MMKNFPVIFMTIFLLASFACTVPTVTKSYTASVSLPEGTTEETTKEIIHKIWEDDFVTKISKQFPNFNPVANPSEQGISLVQFKFMPFNKNKKTTISLKIEIKSKSTLDNAEEIVQFAKAVVEEAVSEYFSKKANLDSAIADFTKAIEINPKDVVAYGNRGLAWHKKGDYDKAIADFTKVTEIDPKYAPTYYNRGLTWEKKGDYDKAIADYSKAIEIDPKLGWAYNNRGNAWSNKGDLNKAIADFTKAIGINPNYAEAYYNRGLAWHKKGELDKAKADRDKAIEINPSLSAHDYE
jgi:tetratricopeptide (TPR) repeat protein